LDEVWQSYYKVWVNLKKGSHWQRHDESFILFYHVPAKGRAAANLEAADIKIWLIKNLGVGEVALTSTLQVNEKRRPTALS
jgi:hypothetical protein